MKKDTDANNVDDIVEDTVANTIVEDKAPMILAVETSCDETAFSILKGSQVLSHQVNSQATLHAEFGGVFPALAKREHDANFTPLLALCFKESFGVVGNDRQTHMISDTDNHAHTDTHHNPNHNLDEETIKKVRSFLSRENNLAEDLIKYIQSLSHEDFLKIKSNLDAIAVTYGPGLEPALWVGISGAKALSVIFDLPLFPINHMEGHIASVVASTATDINDAYKERVTSHEMQFPAIALLISGGHTEIIHVASWHHYRLLGQTVDDAVGEAYDKVARLLGLPYPGGPQISRLAEAWRSQDQQPQNQPNEFSLPRPMLNSKDFNFSFSGLKTACLYAVRDKIKSQDGEPLSQNQKESLAAEFEQAVTDTLLHKTKQALEEYGAQTLIIGGGVIANQFIRENFTALCRDLGVALFIPEKKLATDNATMIGLVANLQIIDGQKGLPSDSQEFLELKAEGNLTFLSENY